LHTETAIQQRKDISDRLFAILLILPAMIVIVFVIVYPLTNAIYTSFFRYFLTDGLGMNFIGLQNYQRMLSSPEFWKAFLHTIEYVGGTVALEFVIAFHTVGCRRIHRQISLLRSFSRNCQCRAQRNRNYP
jgi:multiple sugar transport system permease protein